MADSAHTTLAPEIDRRAFVAMVGTAGMMSAGVETSLGGEHPDAALLELSAALDASYRHEKHVACVAENSRCQSDEDVLIEAIQASERIFNRIVPLPAHTLDGARVKAQAFAWQINEQWSDYLDDVCQPGERLTGQMAQFLLEAV